MTCEFTALRDGYNLDVLTKPGAYFVTDPTNGPSTGDWYVHVYVAKFGGAARQFQLAWSDAGNAGHTRSFTGTTGWTSWSSVASGGTFDGTVPEDFYITGDISPSQLTGNNNNYNPTGLSTATILRLSSDADGRQITGIQGGADGRILALTNVGSNTIVLPDEDTNSDAANRLALGAQYTLQAGAGIILYYDSTSSRWRPLVGRPTDFQNVVLETFTASGTWTKDAGLVAATVIVVGGGGAGGGAQATSGSQASAGAGGSAGGIAIESFAAGDLSATETVTVGAGGTPASGTTGGNGGTSSFGALCSATGGAGGSVTTAGGGAEFAVPGSGGVGSGGDLNIRGPQGGVGYSANGSGGGFAGRGADSEYGGGGEATAGTSAAGGDAQGNGSGGGGALNDGTQSARSGGAGAAGIVIVAEYY